MKYGSAAGGDVKGVANPLLERSTSPLHPADYMDPSMCYMPNGYAPYFYGGNADNLALISFSRFVFTCDCIMKMLLSNSGLFRL